MAARKKKPAEQEKAPARGGWGVSRNKVNRGQAWLWVVLLPDGTTERGGRDTQAGAREDAEEVLSNARARMAVKA